MSLFNLSAIANQLPASWQSTVLAKVGAAQIKVLRMDGSPYPAETHDYNEALLVLDGTMMLEVRGETIEVRAGQMYLAQAGVPHSVLPGSSGTLVIIDL